MESYEHHIAYAIVGSVACFWYALTLLSLIYNPYQPIGWLFAAVSGLAFWGMKRYTEWLYQPSSRRRLLIALSAWQIIQGAVFFMILKAKLP